MRSRKDLPGSCVTFTTMRSESTVVPPVTALRSPPDSRMTGADSPVMADSSTAATPSTTVPSAGIMSPASTTTRSPGANSEADTVSTVPSESSRCATVSVRALRSVSACALPRPSASASAKLANSTVNHSHREIWPLNPASAPVTTREKNEAVVNTQPTATTNMTGLRTSTRGSSLRKASLAA